MKMAVTGGRMAPRRSVRALLSGGALLLLVPLASARPGGGEIFSGGGGHGYPSGGGDAGAFELVFLLVRLVIVFPELGVPLLLGAGGYFALQAMRNRRDRDWDSGPPAGVGAPPSAHLERIHRVDPDFSQVLFEDFCFRLYATAHRARSDARALGALAPYLAEPARSELARRPPVIVGAVRARAVHVPPEAGAASEPVRVAMEYEANTTAGAPGGERTVYAVERWHLERAASARTQPQKGAHTFPCPSCGAPFEPAAGSRETECRYCHQIVDRGRFDWQVARIELLHADERPPVMTREVPERGTDLPTYFQPDLDARWMQLVRDDPAVTDSGLLERLSLIYAELNAAWSAGDLAGARPFVSDGLHDYLGYWMRAYRDQGLRNALEDMRILHAVTAKVVRDRWYDAVTLRLWATGRDTVVREASGEVVRGNPRRERRYSEYWTLIRAAGAQGAPRTEKSCPSCGASLRIEMAGTCHYCGVHVTAGEFDWVLSKIEQDDTYRG
jgi:predicted RNA-binding Zn-ribbon protein involved in translation (DUF1610 family)